ncbi:phosphatidate cytidylyltransferase [Ligilactobacillus murinus]|jgi:phosphatidate cytidylyltransferase|uniref:phosphatidate cytidylyltransferase n=1 Tax=Ligilactobacillus murinus TaxID=1622 RepID=UPI0014335516|nr:phosphatidate cytidylyltransferase [Ligilactobacillus murinus]GFI64387.1 phosphatidate cytidylyltransferase [Lactobacillaceae bacterium]MCR1890646.1 phosphatidate cytidylyltransferase [Ligilactobacillus murinus]MCR1896012.1 phosphatidate cytidylyltransferase [Ligilactobacillus murinus]WRY38600.1 phosphatidate cytidylyltransferase [Ligilactobacillus murinus]BDI01700.1 phosphatidate cytidylyltransferase [Ligilactobacillus murinus]
MKQRVITAVIALIIFLPLLYLGGLPFDILVTLMGIVAMSEFLIMKKKLLVSFEAIVSFLLMLSILLPVFWAGFWTQDTLGGSFYLLALVMLVYTVISKNRFSFDDAGVLLLGGLYAGLGFRFMMLARAESLWMMLYALLIVWVTDSGAYLIGRKIGKNKLAPHISPNKTWEGSIGGSLSAVVIVGAYLYFVQAAFPYSFSTMLLWTLVFSVGGQLGDLIESAFKRHYGVKDSGKILPGHGGILDRFDSLLFVLPLMHFAGLI